MKVLGEGTTDGEGYEVSEGTELAPPRGTPGPEEEHLYDLLSRCPRSQGFYFKLYRIDPADNTPTFIQDVRDYETWSDLETEIFTLLKAQGNPKSGKYRILTFKDRERGQRSRPLEFKFEFPEASTPAGPSSDIKSQLAEVGGLLKDFKDIGLIPGQPQGGTDIGRIISDSIKAGIDVAKSAMPAQREQSPLEKLAERILTEKLTGEKTEKKSSMEELAEKLLMEKLAEKSDPLAEITRIKEMAALFVPGAAPVEEPSPWVELFKSFGPQIPGIVDKLTRPINEFLAFQREKLAYMNGNTLKPAATLRGGFLPKEEPVIAAAPDAGSPPLNEQPATGQDRPVSGQEEDMNILKLRTFVSELAGMITAGNRDFEHVLNGLKYTFGSGVVDQYIEGRLTKEQVLQGLQTFNKYFTAPEAVSYVHDFFAWVDSEMLPETYVCPQCGTEEDLTAAEFKEEPNCGVEGCEGILVLKTAEAAASNNGNGGNNHGG